MFQNFLKTLNHLLEKFMPFLTPSGVIIGLLLGDHITSWAPAVTWLFAFMTFTGALGINAKDFIGVVKKPLPILVFLVSFHILMPVLAWGLASLVFPNDKAMVTGIVLLFSIPTAVSGSIWATIHNGNMPLTITIILVDTLLAPFLTPAIVSFFMKQSVEIDTSGMFLSLLWMVVIPSIIGICINQLSKGKIPQKITPVCKPTSKIALLLVIIINAARIRHSIGEFESVFFLAGGVSLVLAFSGFVIGAFSGRLLKLPRPDSVSLMYASGMRNISAALVLALTYFEPRAGIPIVIGIVFQQTLATFAGLILLPKKDKTAENVKKQ